VPCPAQAGWVPAPTRGVNRMSGRKVAASGSVCRRLRCPPRCRGSSSHSASSPNTLTPAHHVYIDMCGSQHARVGRLGSRLPHRMSEGPHVDAHVWGFVQAQNISSSSPNTLTPAHHVYVDMCGSQHARVRRLCSRLPHSVRCTSILWVRVSHIYQLSVQRNIIV